jgi:isoleucyl-tRNA synthetase
VSNRSEIDRWIISKLNTLIREVNDAYEQFEPTRAGRLIQDFVNDQLSNWYVRLCRRRYWKQASADAAGKFDKLSAYQTLYTCLETVAVLASPIAPFYMDRLFNDLNAVSGKHDVDSVHLANFPSSDQAKIDEQLEAQMDIAQRVSSLVLGLRKKEKIRVRQPLQKIMVPALDKRFADNIRHVSDLILSEVNVKELELLSEDNTILVKSIRPNFKTIGPKYGKQMKAIAAMVGALSSEQIAMIEAERGWKGDIEGLAIELDLNDFEITAQDIPGWTVSSDGNITVALDVTITDELRAEGIARELINRVQNLRKDSGLDVTDRILLKIDTDDQNRQAILTNQNFVKGEVLAEVITFTQLDIGTFSTDLVADNDTRITIERL